MLTFCSFGAVMLVGAVVTYFLIPEVQHRDRKSKTLEVLANDPEPRPRPPKATTWYNRFIRSLGC